MGNRSAVFSKNIPGLPANIIDCLQFPGNVFFVNSTHASASDAAGFGENPDSPCATIDYAVGLCTSNNGDVIIVHPAHAENLGADSAIDIDVIGVRVLGIRFGNMMPTLTGTAVAGDCKLAAAGVSIENIRFLGGIDEMTGIIEVSAANCAIKNCEYQDSTGQATDIIITTAGANNLLIDGFRCIGSADAGGNSAIALVGADDCEIKNFYIYGNFAVGAIDLRTTASPRVNIHDGFIWTENAADIAIVDTITGSTGTIGPNINIMLQDNAGNITTAVTGATFQMFDPIYVCNLVNEKGMLSTWTATTNA